MPPAPGRMKMKRPFTSHHVPSTYRLHRTNETIGISGSQLLCDLLHEINNRTTYPPCPPIQDRITAQRIVTVQRTAFQQRFEWLGDLWINKKIGDMVVAELEDELDDGTYSYRGVASIWSQMKSNAVFSMLAFRLGLARSPTSKQSANIFEAYIHLMSIDQNKHLLVPWIENLFQPLVTFAVTHYIRRTRSREEFELARKLHAEMPLQQAPSYHEDADGYLVIDDSDDDDEETEVDRALVEEPSTDPGRRSASRTVTPEDKEQRKYGATIVDMGVGVIYVIVDGIATRRPVRIWLKNSPDSIKNHNLNENFKTMEILWQSPATAEEDINEDSNNEDSNNEDGEDDDELIVESFTSVWGIGSKIKIWVPFKNGESDREVPIYIAHPWNGQRIR